MTNLQAGATRLSTPLLRRLWLWVPIGIGALLATALATTVLAPVTALLQRDSARLREVQELSARLASERQRAASLEQKQEQATSQRAALVRVISGSGDLSTFLATLDQLAKANRVQLDLYEPQADGKSPDRNKDGRVDDQEKKAKPAADPLEVDGMQRNSLELAARGSYPQLLEFLRQLEALNVLVVQTDLQLNLEGATANAPAGPAATGPEALRPRPVVLNMLLGLYNKTPEASKPGGSK